VPNVVDIAKTLSAVFVISLIISILYAVVSATSESRQACEDRGGVYLMRDGVCLDKGLTR
jgi:uncharacterized membrane protein